MTKYTRAGDMLQRAAAVGFPIVKCRGMWWQGEENWVRMLSDALPVHLDEVERQLVPIEERFAHAAAINRECDLEAAERRERDRAAQRAALRDLLGE
jgi:hypothetical protein